jgi:acyl-CoA reductase-like NAD-dependent aldehyde dehydrogenase
MSLSYTSFSNGKPVTHAGETIKILSPVDLYYVGDIIEANAEVVGSVVHDAEAAFIANRKSTLLQRSTWLLNAASKLEVEAESIIKLIVQDIGKPRKAATFEVARSVQFLRGCASAVLQLGGETIPLDATLAGAGHFGYTKYVPYGVVAAITPFNAPINLLVQKVGPAIAAGNAVVVKPHPAGTRVALRVAELFSESGCPAGLFNVLTGDRIPATLLVSNLRVAAITFTGGTAAGHALARAAGAKKMVAELGSNAANIVLADADVEAAAKKIASAAFEASGQQCISAQRIIVAHEIYDDFVEAFVKCARALKVGDPNDLNTDLGPMISLAAAQRIGQMLESSIGSGGKYATATSVRQSLSMRLAMHRFGRMKHLDPRPSSNVPETFRRRSNSLMIQNLVFREQFLLAPWMPLSGSARTSRSVRCGLMRPVAFGWTHILSAA